VVRLRDCGPTGIARLFRFALTRHRERVRTPRHRPPYPRPQSQPSCAL